MHDICASIYLKNHNLKQGGFMRNLLLVLAVLSSFVISSNTMGVDTSEDIREIYVTEDTLGMMPNIDDSDIMPKQIFQLKSNNPKDKIKKAVFKIDNNSPYIQVNFEEECMGEKTVYRTVYGEQVEIGRVPEKKCVPRESIPIRLNNLVYMKDIELSDEYQTVGRIVYSSKDGRGNTENLMCAEVVQNKGQYGSKYIYDYNSGLTYFRKNYDKDEYQCRLSWNKKPKREAEDIFVSYVNLDVPNS